MKLPASPGRHLHDAHVTEPALRAAQYVRVTLLRPRGASGSSPRASERCSARSCPGSTATSGESSSGTAQWHGAAWSPTLASPRARGRRPRTSRRRAAAGPRPSASMPLERLARRREEQRRVARLDHGDRPVHEVGGRERHGRQVAGLLDLERRLEGGGEVVATARHQQAVGVAQARRHLLHAVLHGERGRSSPAGTSSGQRGDQASRRPPRPPRTGPARRAGWCRSWSRPRRAHGRRASPARRARRAPAGCRRRW